MLSTLRSSDRFNYVKVPSKGNVKLKGYRIKGQKASDRCALQFWQASLALFPRFRERRIQNRDIRDESRFCAIRFVV